SHHAHRSSPRVPRHPGAPAQDGHARHTRHGRGVRARRSHRRHRRWPAGSAVRSTVDRGIDRSICASPRGRDAAPGRSAKAVMKSVLGLWAAHHAELLTLLAQHVVLVAASTLVAIAVAVPLGIFAARRPRLAAPLTAIANIVQTIPSLAMFGFLLPVPLV